MHSLKVITLFMKMKSPMRKRLYQDRAYRQSQEIHTTGRSYCSLTPLTLVQLLESKSEHRSYPFSYYRLTVLCYYRAKETLVLGAFASDPSTSPPFGSGTMVPRSNIAGRQFFSSIFKLLWLSVVSSLVKTCPASYQRTNLTNISFSAVYRRIRQALNVVSRVSKGKSPPKKIRKFPNMF